jgi:hypothetical protein
MWSPHVGFALAGIVILSVGVAVPAQSATDDHIDDKQLEIQRMQHYVPTPEEVAETAAMLAKEQHRMAYGDVAVPAISPGYAIPGDGDVVLRVYPGVNIDAVEKALEVRDQLPYEFEYSEEAGRTGRSTQPSADTR